MRLRGMKAIIFLFLIIFLTGNFVHAMTFTSGNFMYDVSLDKSSYSGGEDIVVTVIGYGYWAGGADNPNPVTHAPPIYVQVNWLNHAFSGGTQYYAGIGFPVGGYWYETFTYTAPFCIGNYYGYIGSNYGYTDFGSIPYMLSATTSWTKKGAMTS